MKFRGGDKLKPLSMVLKKSSNVKFLSYHIEKLIIDLNNDLRLEVLSGTISGDINIFKHHGGLLENFPYLSKTLFLGLQRKKQRIKKEY